MANIFKSIVNSLKLQDDDDDDIELDDEPEERVRERVVRRKKQQPQAAAPVERAPERRETAESDTSSSNGFYSRKAHTASNYNSSTYIENRGGGKAIRMERPEGNKIIPIKTTHRGLEICIMKPRTFEDSQDICDVLLSERAAIINLNEFDINLAQRIMDFVSGAVYSMNGKLYQISDVIFIVSPESVDISGDYSDILEQSGFEVPTLLKDF
ncbi:MAG: cell division protein SepF [Lachnospiraceae bacterium]|nr:cell division protein SepF [Lachnospiraceae bacterium]